MCVFIENIYWELDFFFFFQCGKRIFFLLQLQRLGALMCKYIKLYKADMVKLLIKKTAHVKLCDNFLS